MVRPEKWNLDAPETDSNLHFECNIQNTLVSELSDDTKVHTILLLS